MTNSIEKTIESQVTSINKVKRSRSKLLWGVIYTFLILLIIFTYIRTKVYYIPSSSMEGTLQKGDVVWTKKFDGQQFQRGDILVFQKTDKKDAICFVKRCIALPGDTLSIENGIVSCNAEKEQCQPLFKYIHQIKLFSDTLFQNIDQIIDLTNCRIQRTEEHNTFNIIIHQAHLEDVRNSLSLYGTIEHVPRPRISGRLYPWSNQIASSFDNFGPVVIPKKGMTVSLAGESIYWYKSVIESEEGEITVISDTILIKENPSRTYTFKRDYLFMMGDNRHDSRDSRVFGFIPNEDVIAKATRIVFSISKDENLNRKRIALERSLMRLE